MHDLGVSEWQQRAQAHRAHVERELQRATQLHHDTKRLLQETLESRQAMRVQAAAAFLPSFDPATLEVCERLAGLPPGWAAAQLKKVGDEDQALAARIAEIERDERVQRKDELLGDEGEWRTELEEQERDFRPLHDQVLRFESLPDFRELIDSGYDTPAFDRSWWQPSYYRLWKHADEACEKLGQEPFQLVRELYLQTKERYEAQRRKRDAVKAKVGALEHLLHEREQKIARRQALHGAAPLADARTSLAEWLGNLNRRALAETLEQAGRKDLLDAVLKLDGLETKSKYLEHLLEDDELADGLRGELGKVENDIAKYGRPKKAGTRFPLDKVKKRFEDRPARWNQQLQQRSALLDRFSSWDDWDDVDYDQWSSGVPWWYFFTGSRSPGYGSNFSDVSSWMNQNPSWTYSRQKRSKQSFMDDAAAALANQQVGDQGSDVS